MSDKTAEEVLNNYIKDNWKVPLDQVKYPSFTSKTILKLMKEYAKEEVKKACKEQRYICANQWKLKQGSKFD